LRRNSFVVQHVSGCMGTHGAAASFGPEGGNDGLGSQSRTSVRTTVRTRLKRSDTGTTIRSVNQYNVEGVLGVGAFGVVYKATNTLEDASPLEQTVAVKVLRRSILKRQRVGRTGSAFDSVAREIAVMKKIDHPNCVRLFEVIDDPAQDELFLALEYVDGGEVADLCKDGPLQESIGRSIARDVCAGLAHLHSNGIVHRDIKPSNMLLWHAGLSWLAERL